MGHPTEVRILEIPIWITAAFWGMVLSYFTFALIGIVISLSALDKSLAVLAGVVILAIATYALIL